MLLQHGADPSIRNSEGKTATDVADLVTKPVLTGEYKKEDLLEASRYVQFHEIFANKNELIFNYYILLFQIWKRRKIDVIVNSIKCELPCFGRSKIYSLTFGGWLQSNSNCSIASPARC